MNEIDNCSNSRFQRGLPYPRTCKDCGLGPCKRGFAVKTPAEVADDRAAMTISMVERVAAGQAAFDGRTLIGMSRGERERYFERARIAIRDLNEPTPAMIAAGWRAVSQAKKAAGIARLGPGPGLVEFYRATTAAALNEQVS